MLSTFCSEAPAPRNANPLTCIVMRRTFLTEKNQCHLLQAFSPARDEYDTFVQHLNRCNSNLYWKGFALIVVPSPTLALNSTADRSAFPSVGPRQEWGMALFTWTYRESLCSIHTGHSLCETVQASKTRHLPPGKYTQNKMRFTYPSAAERLPQTDYQTQLVDWLPESKLCVFTHSCRIW